MTNEAYIGEFDGAVPIPAVGEVIAEKYRVDSVVGTGGMGVVLCATHLGLGQRVAIKVLTVPEDNERQVEARERFLREGRATAALVSDHVVRVYDVGTLDNGAPFMVMELLRGQDLAHTLQQQGPLGIELACDCVRQAAEAIACAHAHGIVHRDLKPSNLFLTQRSDGTPLVKVLDFGISKATNSEQEQVTGDLTAERSVLGTPFYMSPEQVRDAKKVDSRTDIWSLGLILHELLSGSPAFEGTTLPGVCASIAADPPAALRLKRPDVPVEVEAIVLKCLEKDPAKRFQAARELVDRLTPWAGRVEGGGISSPLSDATIRSSSSLGFELSALRDGSTVKLSPPSDTGTLASAVFTRSRPRLGEARSASASKQDATLAEPPLEKAATTPVRSPPTSRRAAGLGMGALLLLLLFAWALRRPGSPAVATPGLPPLPSVPAPAPTLAAVPASAAFSLQIESNPGGADVFESDVLLGRTPIRVSIDPAGLVNGPRTFTVRKAGYLPYTVVQGAGTKDARVWAELSPEPAVTAPRRPIVKKSTPAARQVTSQPVKSANDIFMQR